MKCKAWANWSIKIDIFHRKMENLNVRTGISDIFSKINNIRVVYFKSPQFVYAGKHIFLKGPLLAKF